MKMKVRKFYETRLYIGCHDNKLGRRFYENDLIITIKESQEVYKTMIPVRVAETKYVSGQYYQEEGWEISIINYPRIEITSSDINDFAAFLASRLLKRFNQNRICIVNPTDIIMVEP